MKKLSLIILAIFSISITTINANQKNNEKIEKKCKKEILVKLNAESKKEAFKFIVNKLRLEGYTLIISDQKAFYFKTSKKSLDKYQNAIVLEGYVDSNLELHLKGIHVTKTCCGGIDKTEVNYNEKSVCQKKALNEMERVMKIIK